MHQRFVDAEVGVAQLDVLADEGDADGLARLVDLLHHPLPLPVVRLLRETECPGNVAAETGALEDQRNLVDRRGGRHADDGFLLDVAEEGDLVADVVRHLLVGAADDDIRLDTDAPEVTDTHLGRLGLHLAGGAELGEEGDVDTEAVATADLSPHLANGLQVCLALDIADRAADLDDDDVGVMLPGGKADAALDLVGDMRDDLDGAAEVVTTALLGDDRGVDLAGGDVRRPGEVLVDEALVVAEVEVGLGAVVRHEDLTMLVGRHRAGVDVEIGVELHDRDAGATILDQPSERGCGDALAD